MREAAVTVPLLVLAALGQAIAWLCQGLSVMSGDVANAADGLVRWSQK